jgi:hypothetical protein
VVPGVIVDVPHVEVKTETENYPVLALRKLIRVEAEVGIEAVASAMGERRGGWLVGLLALTYRSHSVHCHNFDISGKETEFMVEVARARGSHHFRRPLKSHKKLVLFTRDEDMPTHDIC